MRTLPNLVKKMIDRQTEWIKNTHSSYVLLLQEPEETDPQQSKQYSGLRLKVEMLSRPFGLGPIQVTIESYWHGKDNYGTWMKGHWSQKHLKGDGRLRWCTQDEFLTPEGHSALSSLWYAVQQKSESTSVLAAEKVLGGLL